MGMTPEADALDAVDFVETAVVEAEYAVLDAAVARTNADDLAASAWRPAPLLADMADAKSAYSRSPAASRAAFQLS